MMVQLITTLYDVELQNFKISDPFENQSRNVTCTAVVERTFYQV